MVAQGEARVAELESRGEVSVDEVVCGISIVHNQYVYRFVVSPFRQGQLEASKRQTCANG